MVFFSLILYLAAIYIRPGEIVSGWQGFPFVQVITGVSVVIAVIGLLLSPRRFANLPQDKCVLGFYAAAVVSNLAWGWFGGAYEALYLLFPVIFAYFLIRLAVQTHVQLKRVVLLLVSLTLFQAVNGIVQYHTGIGLGNVTVLQAQASADETEPQEGGASADTRIRGTGIFNDPNDLAMALVVAVPFALSWTLRRTNRFNRRLLGIATLIPLLCAIYYTNSRGGIIGLGVVIVIYAYQNFNKRLAFLIAAAGLVTLVALGPSRISEIDSEDDSAQGRIQAWSAGLQMFKEKPIFGVGFGRFTEYHEYVAHNSFVHTFAELGALGSSFFVGMFYFFFKMLRSRDRAASTENAPSHARDWAMDLRTSGIGLLTCACFLSRQYTPIPFIVLALGACHAAVSRGSTSESTRVNLNDIAKITALTVGVVVATYVSVRLLGVWGPR